MKEAQLICNYHFALKTKPDVSAHDLAFGHGLIDEYEYNLRPNARARFAARTEILLADLGNRHFPV